MRNIEARALVRGGTLEFAGEQNPADAISSALLAVDGGKLPAGQDSLEKKCDNYHGHGDLTERRRAFILPQTHVHARTHTIAFGINHMAWYPK